MVGILLFCGDFGDFLGLVFQAHYIAPPYIPYGRENQCATSPRAVRLLHMQWRFSASYGSALGPLQKWVWSCFEHYVFVDLCQLMNMLMFVKTNQQSLSPSTVVLDHQAR